MADENSIVWDVSKRAPSCRKGRSTVRISFQPSSKGYRLSLTPGAANQLCGVSTMVPEKEYLTMILKMTDDEAETILKNAVGLQNLDDTDPVDDDDDNEDNDDE